MFSVHKALAFEKVKPFSCARDKGQNLLLVSALMEDAFLLYKEVRKQDFSSHSGDEARYRPLAYATTEMMS